MLRDDLHEENRRAWNAAAEAHNRRKREQARFLRIACARRLSEESGIPAT